MQLLSNAYFDAPTHEINQAINWLEGMEDDFQKRLAEVSARKKDLLSIKEDRDRSKTYRQGIKSLVNDFKDPAYLDMPAHLLSEIIRQRLGCSHARAKNLVPLIYARAQKERRADRNAQIVALASAGTSKTALAKKYNISRQAVHKIIKKDREKPGLL